MRYKSFQSLKESAEYNDELIDYAWGSSVCAYFDLQWFQLTPSEVCDRYIEDGVLSSNVGCISLVLPVKLLYCRHSAK